MTDEYEALKSALAGGAWIYGIEEDWKLHRIEDPKWTCPPERYIALVPFSWLGVSCTEQVSAWIRAGRPDLSGSA